LVHQHSLTPLALPIKLILPAADLMTQNGEQESKASPGSDDQSSSSIISHTPQQLGSLTPEARLLLEKGAGKYFSIPNKTMI
jgi:hypothetical protein